MATAWRASCAVAATLLLLLPESCDGVEHAPVVRTRQGAVRGTTKQSSSGRHLLAFYNIPYAKPPVGQLRFKSPQPPDGWEHIRDATAPGPCCPQIPLLSPTGPPIGTEDCLYLNVYTPELKPSKLIPVMVWIHGGGFVGGAATFYEYGYLLDHDIVFVTINYRLGSLGFLSTGDESSPGNYGLKDQVMALRWVQENIEAFGGDPGSVTIFGESAGAASTHLLMLSPLAKGLFHRAISQSGVALVPWAVSQTGVEQIARKLAMLVGCPTEPSAALVDCLRGIDDHELIKAQPKFEASFLSPTIPFRPTVEADREGAFLPRHPLDLEYHSAVPWLVGVTKDEGCLFTAALAINNTLLEEFQHIAKNVLPVALSYDRSLQVDVITEKIYEFYFPSGELTFSKVTELYSDALFIWNTDEAVRKYKDTAPVYYYLFSYQGEIETEALFGAQEDLGVLHGEELLYLFSNTTILPIPAERSKEDTEMAKTMSKMWTDFVKTGNPTPTDEGVHWPRVVSDRELEYLNIGQTLQAGKGLFQERVDFWRSLPIRETQQQSKSRDEF